MVSYTMKQHGVEFEIGGSEATNPARRFPNILLLPNANYYPPSCGVAKRCYYSHVTTLLDQGIEAILELPDEGRDMAGEILLALAAAGPRYELTPEQIEDLKLSIAQADRGEFASDEDVAKMWKKFGL
jgi:hypothetical protein